MIEHKEKICSSEVVVFGGSGLVGSRFLELTGIENVSRAKADITNRGKLREWIGRFPGKVIVNFAAYTNVEGAEKEKGDKSGQVWEINVEGAKNLAEISGREGKFLIHLSTDFVFPGTEDSPGPYQEDAIPLNDLETLSWYGYTKLKGEEEVRSVNGAYAIVRISYPYRASFDGKIDFARNILSLYDQGKLYPMFTDQKITLTFIDEVVVSLQKIAQQKQTGVYHVASCDLTTPYHFASYLLEKTKGVRNVVGKGSMAELLTRQGVTPRPRIGGLSTELTQNKLGLEFRSWQAAVDEFVKQRELIEPGVTP